MEEILKKTGISISVIGAIVALGVISVSKLNVLENPDILKFGTILGLIMIIWGSVMSVMKENENENVIEKEQFKVPEYSLWIILAIIYLATLSKLGLSFYQTNTNLGDIAVFFPLMILLLGSVTKNIPTILVAIIIDFILVSQTHSNIALFVGSSGILSIPLILNS